MIESYDSQVANMKIVCGELGAYYKALLKLRDFDEELAKEMLSVGSVKKADLRAALAATNIIIGKGEELLKTKLPRKQRRSVIAGLRFFRMHHRQLSQTQVDLVNLEKDIVARFLRRQTGGELH